MICSVPSQSPGLEGKLSKPFPLPPSPLSHSLYSPPLRRPPHFTSRTMLGFSAAGDDNPLSGNRAREREGEGERGATCERRRRRRRRWCPPPPPPPPPLPRCNCRCLTLSLLSPVCPCCAVRFFGEGHEAKHLNGRTTDNGQSARSVGRVVCPSLSERVLTPATEC